MSLAGEAPPRHVLHGRRRGRPLSARRQALIDQRLPALRPATGSDGTLDLKGPLPGLCRLWLEIGFGAGEHLAWQAERHPGIWMLGAEPYRAGVAALLARIEERGLANVRIFDGDARALLDALPEASLERIFVLFPDPWPKTRHRKRRLVDGAMAARFAALLTDGGQLRLASDVGEHVRWLLAALRGCPQLAWTARRPGDWRQRPPDWPATRYEAKARSEGRRPVFLSFVRRPRQG